MSTHSICAVMWNPHSSFCIIWFMQHLTYLLDELPSRPEGQRTKRVTVYTNARQNVFKPLKLIQYCAQLFIYARLHIMDATCSLECIMTSSDPYGRLVTKDLNSPYLEGEGEWLCRPYWRSHSSLSFSRRSRSLTAEWVGSDNIATHTNTKQSTFIHTHTHTHSVLLHAYLACHGSQLSFPLL